MNKYSIGAIALVALFIGLVLVSGGPEGNSIAATKTESSSKIVVLEEPYDFGDIEIFAGKVSTNYTLKNEGTEEIIITKAVTSCMCTEGEIAGFTFGMHGSEVKEVVIPPGGEEVVTAIFDPLAHGPNGVGPITRTLLLETNSIETPTIELKFKGNVIKTESQ